MSWIHRFLLPATALLGLLGLWELWVRVLGTPEYILPTPSAIFGRIVGDWALLLKEAGVTLYEVLVGFAVGAAAGLGLAIVMIHSRTLERAIMPVAVFLQTTPKLAVAPLFLIWFGYGILPKIVVVVLMTLFPVLISAMSGLRSADARLLELMTTLNASKSQVLWKIRFPGAMPHLFAGLKVAITFSVIGAIVGEWVGASAGLGHLILSANSQLDTELAFAAIFVLSLMGTALFLVVQQLEKRVLVWHDSIQTAGIV